MALIALVRAACILDGSCVRCARLALRGEQRKGRRAEKRQESREKAGEQRKGRRAEKRHSGACECSSRGCTLNLVYARVSGLSSISGDFSKLSQIYFWAGKREVTKEFWLPRSHGTGAAAPRTLGPGSRPKRNSPKKRSRLKTRGNETENIVFFFGLVLI